MNVLVHFLFSAVIVKYLFFVSSPKWPQHSFVIKSISNDISNVKKNGWSNLLFIRKEPESNRKVINDVLLYMYCKCFN